MNAPFRDEHSPSCRGILRGCESNLAKLLRMALRTNDPASGIAQETSDQRFRYTCMGQNGTTDRLGLPKVRL